MYELSKEEREILDDLVRRGLIHNDPVGEEGEKGVDANE